MVEMLFTHTNKRIELFLSELAEEVLQSGKYPHLKCTDAIELKAFMGLFYYRGLYNLTFHSLDILFSKFDGPPVFSATMSSNRFKFLLWNLCFDDVATRNDSWSHNRFANVIWKMRIQVALKQYNLAKPSKYGLLFKWINSARYAYTLQAHTYCGKPVDEPNEYYVCETSNYVSYLVEQLEKIIPWKEETFQWTDYTLILNYVTDFWKKV